MMTFGIVALLLAITLSLIVLILILWPMHDLILDIAQSLREIRKSTDDCAISLDHLQVDSYQSRMRAEEAQAIWAEQTKKARKS
jgi:hypothetical protein